MQTDSHIEVVSPDRYYAYSRHTERTFCNYESPCQARINPMLATSLLHYNICYIRKKIYSYICYSNACANYLCSCVSAAVAEPDCQNPRTYESRGVMQACIASIICGVRLVPRSRWRQKVCETRTCQKLSLSLFLSLSLSSSNAHNLIKEFRRA